jgi:TetR/AcrR family tetracycline transcriptional repressor
VSPASPLHSASPDAGPRKRGRPPRVGRDDVVRAALAVVDSEGLDALTMHHVAEALGVTAMTLYRHIEDKGALIDALVDVVLDEVPPTPVDDGQEWASAVVAYCRRLRQAVLAHPALASLVSRRVGASVRDLGQMDAVVGVLRAQGFDGSEAVQVVLAAKVYTLGALAWEVPRTRLQSKAAYRQQVRQVAQRLPVDSSQHLRELWPAVADGASDEQFERGLTALLTGFATTFGVPR